MSPQLGLWMVARIVAGVGKDMQRPNGYRLGLGLGLGLESLTDWKVGGFNAQGENRSELGHFALVDA